MHATMVEALDIFTGARVLDIGSGCGVVTAMCALLAGSTGHAIGIDIRKDCCDVATKSVARLRELSTEFSTTAAPCEYHHVNAFLLHGTAHEGQYDRIHVGASCPPDHLLPFVRLLKKDVGGMIVVPVAPSDLKLIVKRPDGRIIQKVMSQVRFSELEVPGDAEVVLAAMRAERRSRISDSVALSTFDEDMAGARMSVSDDWKKDGGLELSSSPAGVVDAFPPSPVAASPSSSSSSFLLMQQQQQRQQQFINQLGEPDCVLVKERSEDNDNDDYEENWQIRAHCSVLCHRCDVLRARCNSGMADAQLHGSSIHIPGHFKKSAVDLFLHYVYTDQLECTAEQAASVLHVANYFGVPRCVQLCEHMLAKVLKNGGKSSSSAPQQKVVADGAVEAAASLLALADDAGLPHLRAVALDLVVCHYEEVEKTESYAALSRDQVAAVAAEACHQVNRAKALLQEARDEADADLEGN